MKKIIAPIDEKNVFTDWIEDVFDNLNCVQNGRQALGFINDDPVYAYWEKNCITWRCVEGNGDYESIVSEIKNRLADFEDPNSNLFSECYTIGHAVVQNFFFRAD